MRVELMTSFLPRTRSTTELSGLREPGACRPYSVPSTRAARYWRDSVLRGLLRLPVGLNVFYWAWRVRVMVQGAGFEPA